MLCLGLVLAAYASIATFFISNATLSENLRAFRWGVEATFFLLTLFIVMGSVIESPLRWGRFFCGVTILGSVIAIIDFGLVKEFEGRLAGWGALTNPISAASVLLVYWAIGTFALLHNGQKVDSRDLAWSFSGLAFLLVVSLLSESRGPVIALLIYLFWFSIALTFQKRFIKFIWILPAVLIIDLLLVEKLYGLQAYFSDMLDRGTSYRLEIWSALIEYPPDSLLFGEGAGTSLMSTEAGELIFEPMGLVVTHAHNIFIGTFTEIGLLGLILLFSLLGLPLWSTLNSPYPVSEKLHLLGLLGLMLMLCMTTAHTLVISIKAVWFYSWLPLVFVWFWSRRAYGPKRSDEAFFIKRHQ